MLCATCLVEEDSLLYGGLQVLWGRVIGYTMCYMPGGGEKFTIWWGTGLLEESFWLYYVLHAWRRMIVYYMVGYRSARGE